MKWGLKTRPPSSNFTIYPSHEECPVFRALTLCILQECVYKCVFCGCNCVVVLWFVVEHTAHQAPPVLLSASICGAVCKGCAVSHQATCVVVIARVFTARCITAVSAWRVAINQRTRLMWSGHLWSETARGRVNPAVILLLAVTLKFVTFSCLFSYTWII